METARMKTAPVLSLRVNEGFGLLQRLGCLPGSLERGRPFYIIYKTKIDSLSPDKISNALKGDYYYARFVEKDSYSQISYIDVAMQANGKEIELSLLKKEILLSSGRTKIVSPSYCEGCYLSYLGDYPLPHNAAYPLYSRGFSLSVFTGEHYWTLHDELWGMTIDGIKHSDHILDEKGRRKIFKTLTKDIASYPLYGDEPPKNILEQFNLDWSPEKFNDATLEKIIDNYYRQHPYMRPCDAKFDDLKLSLPTESWRNMVVEDENTQTYLSFCDKIDEILNEFIKAIESNRRAVRKHLTKLNNDLNQLEEEIDTLEAEELFAYLAKLLHSIKKPKLIAYLEETRNW